MSKYKQTIQTNTPTNTTPSQFGSHSSMINQELTDRLIDPVDPELIKLLSNDVRTKGNVVVLTDQYGNYATLSQYLDSGLADVNRGRGFSALEKSTSISAINFLDREDMVTNIVTSEVEENVEEIV